MKKIISTIFIIFFVPLTASSKSVIFSFEEMVQRAKLIIICELNEIEFKLFTENLADVKVIETIKGDSNIKSVYSFGLLGLLGLGLLGLLGSGHSK